MRQLLKLERLLRREVVEVLSGLYRSKIKGSGLEFDSLRIYTPQDEARRIDWRIFAKTGELFVKVFKEHKQVRILFWLDFSYYTTLTLYPYSVIKKMYEVFYYLVQAASYSKDPVGVFLNGSAYTLIPPQTPLSSFFRSRVKIFELLRNYKRKGDLNYPFEAFEYFINYALEAFPRNSLVFIFNPYPDWDVTFMTKVVKKLTFKHTVIWYDFLEVVTAPPKVDLFGYDKWIGIDGVTAGLDLDYKAVYRRALDLFSQHARIVRKLGADHHIFKTNLSSLKQLIWSLNR